eukprot:gb/GECH01006883.1/.p1 GENE.gb/GECH01006883.1/~~gb/GECH01006883.1/.p1  ORF type:complete len:663 (+),score=183.84 gb/GECH01006883.1/:1-1989(+)
MNVGAIFKAWCIDTQQNNNKNNFDKFQEKLSKNCSQESFVMRSYRLGIRSALAIARCIAGSSSPFKKVDVHENVIRDAGLAGLLQLLNEKGGQHLEILDVGSNDIGTEGGQSLARTLLENRSLRVLICGSKPNELYTNHFDGSVGVLFADVLRNNNVIQALDLSLNPLGRDSQQSFEMMAAALPNATSLHSLRLASTQLTTDSAIQIVSSLHSSPTLRLLDISGNHLGSEIADYLSELIASTPISTLLIGNNDLDASGAITLSGSLGSPSCVLCVLDMSENNIGNEGCSHIAEALQDNSTVTHLSLAGNHIGYHGCYALASAVKSVSVLSSLSMQRNGIGDGGAISMAKAVEDHQSLSHLDLAQCRISDEGCVSFSVSLSTNRSLISLSLESNHITEGGGMAFCEMLMHNNELTHLLMKGNQIEHSTLLRIRKILSENRERKMGKEPAKLEREVIRLRYQQVKLREAEAELNEKRTLRQDKQDEMEQLRRELDKTTTQGLEREEEMKQQISIEENLIDDIQKKIQEDENEVLELRQKFDTVTTQYNEKLEKKEEKKQKIEKRIANLENEIRKNQNSDVIIEELQKETENLREERKDLEESKDQLENESSAIKGEVMKLKRQVIAEGGSVDSDDADEEDNNQGDNVNEHDLKDDSTKEEEERN